jgi:arginase
VRVLANADLPRLTGLLIHELLARGDPELLTSDALFALAESPLLARLETLNIVGRWIDDDGLRALAASPRLAGLRSLVICPRRDSWTGLRALVESPHLSGLSGLDISWQELGPGLAELLARPDVLPSLNRLAIAFPDPAEREALARRFADGLIVEEEETAGEMDGGLRTHRLALAGGGWDNRLFGRARLEVIPSRLTRVRTAALGVQSSAKDPAMPRPVAILGAPSSIGIRPYDESDEARHIDLGPGVLRELGLVARLDAADLGDVLPPPYRDFIRPPGRARNEKGVVRYSRSLADRVVGSLDGGRFVVVLGGDCSIVLGCLLGAGRRAGRIGLAYIDAHADFATPEESQTGSVASMCLALAVGHGDSPLARLAGPAPLVRGEDVALIGRRDESEPTYGHAALGVSGILDLPGAAFPPGGGAAIASGALTRIGRPEVSGFWIHVDADVLNPQAMPAVDSPEPGGPGIDELAAILAPLVDHPKALGMHITLYDPSLDLDRSCARRLVALFESLLERRSAGGGP